MQSQWRLSRVLRKCGTCGHNHAGLDLKCVECACRSFKLDPGEAQIWREREAAIEREYGDNAFLNSEEVQAVLDVFDDVESRLIDVPWDHMPPTIFVVYASHRKVNGTDDLGVLELNLDPIPLPSEFWTQADSPVDVLIGLADQAEQEARWFTNFRRAAGLSMNRPIAAWGFMAESWVKSQDMGHLNASKHPEARADEARVLSAVDIDERVYFVFRSRSGSTPRIVRAATPRELNEAYGMSCDGRVSEALRRLVRVTTRELELAGMFKDLG
jgi:hypothetical protein